MRFSQKPIKVLDAELTKKIKANIVRSKTAIITGGSKGIGLRIAKILAERKYNIVICSRNHSNLISAKKELEKYGIKCLALKADVSDYKQCKMLVRKTLENFLQIDLDGWSLQECRTALPHPIGIFA